MIIYIYIDYHYYIDYYIGYNIFPLYIQYTRTRESNLKVSTSNKLRMEACLLNRYYHSFYDTHGCYIIEGINPGSGPSGFNIREHDIHNYGLTEYESIVIYSYLVKINELLEKFGIQTIQSGIAYWVQDVKFSEPSYFQPPWIEFVGEPNFKTIYIMKQLITHKLASQYLSFTFGDHITDQNDGISKPKIRTSLIRPFVDPETSIHLYGMDDADFWANIIEIIQDVSNNIDVSNLSDDIIKLNEYTELDLHLDKPWFILDQSGHICELTMGEKINKINPFDTTIPLSPLIIRFEPQDNLFMNLNL